MRNSSTLIGFLLSISVNAAFGEVYAPLVDVELLVRGPDAKPLANTTIVVKEPDPFHNDDKPEPPKVTAKTDERGIARFKFPGGKRYNLCVDAEGFGYGNVGIADLDWGATAQLYLPPLAPYGVIEGTIPPEARTPDAMVSTGTQWGDDRVSVKPDADGHFRITNAHAGICGVSVGLWNTRHAQLDHQFVLVPGLIVRNVELKMVDPPKTEPPSNIRRELYPAKGQDMVWVRGNVRDEAGKPVTNATVLARAVYSGGMRDADVTLKTRTDAEGHYEIKGASD
jgi:hypothetical protein